MDLKKYQKLINLSAPILIAGETGTGKSFFAKKIFEESNVYKEKFLTVHLASLKEDTLESELFGHKKGAFTGACEMQAGYFKEVGAGTLFLDEIGELSFDAQKKLLYLLEEKKFTPMGSTLPCDFRGRIIMATNKDLEKMVKEGRFREDLFYRINIFKISLPPLREDPAQLKKMIKIIFFELQEKYKKSNSSISEETLHALSSRKWSGNIRELKNAMEYAIVMSEKSELEFSEDFKDEQRVPVQNKNFMDIFPEDFDGSMEIFEKMYLNEMFQKYAGKVNETARRLGMSKTTLIHKAKKYQINTLKIRAEASNLAA